MLYQRKPYYARNYFGGTAVLICVPVAGDICDARRLFEPVSQEKLRIL